MLLNYREFTGRAGEQTREYIDEVVTPLLERHGDLVGNVDSSLKV